MSCAKKPGPRLGPGNSDPVLFRLPLAGVPLQISGSSPPENRSFHMSANPADPSSPESAQRTAVVPYPTVNPYSPEKRPAKTGRFCAVWISMITSGNHSINNATWQSPVTKEVLARFVSSFFPLERN